jgi:GTP-binding protein HflX
VFERSRKGENALLIQPYSGPADPTLLEEFAELARSAGATVVGTITAKVTRRNPAYYIGTGCCAKARAPTSCCSTSCCRRCRNETSRRRSVGAW